MISNETGGACLGAEKIAANSGEFKSAIAAASSNYPAEQQKRLQLEWC